MKKYLVEKYLSFCRLDEITATKDIIDFEINFGQRKNLASWIYLEKDLYLHYFSL